MVSKIYACPPGGTWEKPATLDPDTSTDDNGGIPTDYPDYTSSEESTEPPVYPFYPDVTKTTESPIPPILTESPFPSTVCFTFEESFANITKTDCNPWKN